MAKMSFLLSVLCGLASLGASSAEPSSYGGAPAPAMYPAPAKYEAPAPKYEAPAPKYEAPAPKYEAPAPKYEAPAPKYEAPAPKYEKKKEKYPTKVEYKKMEYGGKKYKRSIDELDFDPEEFEHSADPKRKWYTPEDDLDEMMDATPARKRWFEDDLHHAMDARRTRWDAALSPQGRWWPEDDLDDMMDAIPRRKQWWSPEELDDIMDARVGKGYTEADELMDARRPPSGKGRRICFRRRGRWICRRI